MYRHTQPGTLLVWTIGSMIVLCLVLVIDSGAHPIPVVATVVAAGLLFLFHSLTVEVRETEVRVQFGPGWIHRTFPLRSIRDARAVRNRWYYGWGIRLTPHGWMFNVSGLDAVELTFDDGRRFRIGTDRPEELVAALRDSLSRR